MTIRLGKKYYTVKEWKMFKGESVKMIDGREYRLDRQELMCRKYDIILTDYRTSREKIISVLKGINFKNFDRGMKKFDDIMDDFNKVFAEIGEDLGGNDKKKKKINPKNRRLHTNPKINLWGEKTVDIFGTPARSATKPRRKKRKGTKSVDRDQENIERIMGKKS